MNKIQQCRMIHMESEFLAEQIVPEFSDTIDHAECFTFRGGVIPFRCQETSASVVNGAIPIRGSFLHYIRALPIAMSDASMKT